MCVRETGSLLLCPQMRLFSDNLGYDGQNIGREPSCTEHSPEMYSSAQDSFVLERIAVYTLLLMLKV